MTPLESFCTATVARTHKDGWIEIVVPIVAPIISKLIERCFDNGTSMRNGLRNLNFAQRIALNNAAREICNDCGIRIGLRGRAVNSIATAIQAEIKEALKLDTSDDTWQAVFEEATRYA